MKIKVSNKYQINSKGLKNNMMYVIHKVEQL